MGGYIAMAADPVIRLSATLCNLVGLACDGLIVRVGGARKRMLAAKQQQCEVERRPAEELASRRQKEAQELWRRARRERHRAEFFWRDARRERRRAEAAWRRVLTGLDPAAHQAHIFAAEGKRLAEILGAVDSDRSARHEF